MRRWRRLIELCLGGPVLALAKRDRLGRDTNETGSRRAYAG